MGDILKEAIATYNKIAELYNKYTSEKILQYQLNKFISMLNGKKILDAGCGAGRDVDYFTEEGYDAVGIDIAEGLLKEAKKKKGKYKVMDFRDLKFKDGSFDGVWSMAGFLHTERDDVPKALKEFYRVLKKKGILFVTVIEGKGKKKVKKAKYKNEPRTYVYFSQKEFEDYLKEIGFEIVNSSIVEDDDKDWIEIYAKKA